MQSEGLFIEQTPLTFTATSHKGEHHATLLSSLVFLKGSSAREPLSLAEYIAFCLLVLQTDPQSAKPTPLLRGVTVNHEVPPWSRASETAPWLTHTQLQPGEGFAGRMDSDFGFIWATSVTVALISQEH